MLGSIVAITLGFALADEKMFNSHLHEHMMRIERMRETMSLKTAETLISKVDAEKLGALQPLLAGDSARKNLRKNAPMLALDGSTTSGSEFDKAMKLLNEMVKEAEFKYETELEKCCHYEKSQTALIEETHTTISTANAQSAEAKKQMLEAQTGITMSETQLPKLKEELAAWNKQCFDQLATIDLMLKSLEGDIDVSSGIIEKTKCLAPSETSKLLLLRCEDECGEYETVQSNETMSPRMKEFALKLLQSGSGDRVSAESGSGERVLQVPALGNTTTSPLPEKIPRARPCKAAISLDPSSSKCSISKSAGCRKVVEKFMKIQTNLQETETELQEKRSDLSENCKLTRENYLTQIEEYEIKLKDYNSMFAGATSTNVEALEISRLKSAQLEKFLHNYKEMTTECHANYASLESEICGLTKIRGEVSKHLKLKTHAVFQDCEVSDWVAVEPGCSVTCGGGVSKLIRTIEVYPDGGADCPDLVKMETCNEEKCPIDCRVGDWSGWSDCSSKCGGGVQDRNRPIITEPEYKGVACGEIQQVQSCNAQSCDKDCVLSDWTAWTKCSKPCNTGHKQRVRSVLQSQVGAGTCPDVDGDVRLNKNACNVDPCPVAASGELLRCRAKRDVIVLIDGSGSVGDAGWKLQMDAAKLMVKAINPTAEGSDMGIIVYSGPKWLCDWYLCMGTHERSKWFGKHCDAKAHFDCGTEILSHLTTEQKSLTDKLEKAKFPGWTTFTSKALGKVEAELSLGQKDAASVVIVMTDGYPADSKATHKAAVKLQKKAKLIWVPITPYAPLDEIQTWAADPEDVIPVANFSDLNETVVNQVTATACDDVDVIKLA